MLSQARRATPARPQRMLSSFVPRRLGSCTLFRRNSSRRALPSTTALHPNSKWPTGVPPAMGEHVMPSGKTAPPSHSTTVATGVPHLFRYHDAETDTRVEARCRCVRCVLITTRLIRLL